MKEAVQEFADHILQLADSPNDSKSSSSSSSSSGRDRGHNSPFLSSMGHRPHRGGFGFRSSYNEGEHDDSYHRHNLSSEGNTSSFRRGGNNQFRGAYVEEPLVPALFYITVAGLTGSILARRSKLFVSYFFLFFLHITSYARIICYVFHSAHATKKKNNSLSALYLLHLQKKKLPTQ